MDHELIQRLSLARQVLVFDEKERMSSFIADRFRETAAGAIRDRGFFSVALSGGKTPAEPYAEIGRRGQEIDWERVHLFLVDERFVPPEDEQSNYRMIKESLVESVVIPRENVHAVPIGGDVRATARSYEAELKDFFKVAQGSLPVFDLILLGMGEDGHTASLFPGSHDFTNHGHLVLPIEPTPGRVARITLTLPVINHGRALFFIVTGAAKARTVRRVVGEGDPSLPASLVRPIEGELIFLLDREAASLLTMDGAEKTA